MASTWNNDSQTGGLGPKALSQLSTLEATVASGSSTMSGYATAFSTTTLTTTAIVATVANTGIKVGAATDKLGFYNHAVVSLQTGVAVDAAGIHAALVALGLITA